MPTLTSVSNLSSSPSDGPSPPFCDALGSKVDARRVLLWLRRVEPIQSELLLDVPQLHLELTVLAHVGRVALVACGCPHLLLGRPCERLVDDVAGDGERDETLGDDLRRRGQGCMEGVEV